MKIELGWFYISITKDGIHIEFEKYPKLWIVLSLNTNLEAIT